MRTTAKISKTSRKGRRNCFIERILIQLKLMFNIDFLHKKGVNGDRFIRIEGRPIRLIIGLGNPGEKYKNTYHNVGFMFLDFILSDVEGNDDGEVPKWKNVKNFRYTTLATRTSQQQSYATITLLKPTSFMNESGEPVRSALRYFKVAPEEILVVHDDADIAFGNHKVSFGKGSAGHNGVESIIKSVGSDKFTRLRIGIRNTDQSAGEFVLSKIQSNYLSELERLFAKLQRNYIKGESE